MADRILLTGLRAKGFHGVFAEEQRLGQDFIVDIACWLDLAPAAISDDLADTINYAELAEIAHAVITGPPMQLIEAVAGRIADTVMQTYPQLYAVEVTVHKPHAPIPRDFADVAVVARRSRGRA
ncbi:dihydroneopterin aldolase [Corynebacterium sp. HS2168-gen11]|uniref:dihydroneopterin aldolase n=1 Tax=Corynebacterium sp. HS2168-gen11 TaxID=2974027 RepID=UPI00216B557E|nr:dihydroneopterin aldolase [Corynebacterium sp. HS2168-gen11]MCS4536109.1 dihydroneopterin aldolase [Corynebacterium sp. HS2168-gen11]